LSLEAVALGADAAIVEAFASLVHLLKSRSP
jgi:hypothetical protein